VRKVSAADVTGEFPVERVAQEESAAGDSGGRQEAP
jgi:hypothetical protein